MKDRFLLSETLVVLLAGGKGERLYPLTRDRAKPAVPFGGIYRIIDFTLSNCLNTGLRKIVVLTQYKSISLERHLKLAWNIFNYQLGEFIMSVPPQQRTSELWYEGTADAVYQNIYTLDEVKPRFVLILSGDHIYQMNYLPMLRYHVRKNADMTVGCIEVDQEDASRMGVLEINGEGRVMDFQEKPEKPKTLDRKKNKSLASMGIYVFNTEKLVSEVITDKKDKRSKHDFGRNIIPHMLKRDKVYGYPVTSYWQDIGTIEAYFAANMELLKVKSRIDLHNRDNPVRTYQEQLPGALVIKPSRNRDISVVNSVLSPGCVIRGATVRESILSCAVSVGEDSVVENGLIFDNVRIGKGCRIRNAIIDKGVSVPDNYRVGFDPKEDRGYFTVTESGLVVIPRGYQL
ncbi:MAG: glucose-1-phosphate adenylyltransferase [Deltaproteobacteria bacterium]|nr:MAG: glucose-1-phosphate adenylyltransferase [Deltaproteobacteria bacterium]